MGISTRRRSEKESMRSKTLPPSPSHSFSSSSEFEFTVSISPRKSSGHLCPADELFYKGQLLPLHLSPRISMVRTLLLSSSSTSSSSDTNTTASRDSTGSASSGSSFASDLALLGTPDCDSSRPSSAAEDDELKRLYHSSNNHNPIHINNNKKCVAGTGSSGNSTKYFSLSRFSAVFKKQEPKSRDEHYNIPSGSSSSVKRMSTTARDVIRKYMKKVKPLYEKLSQKQQQKMATMSSRATSFPQESTERSVKETEFSSGKTTRNDHRNGETVVGRGFSHSFSGNLKYPRKRSCISSCPSSMRSSPSHSGILGRNGFPGTKTGPTTSTATSTPTPTTYADTSSMDELQSAIQGAIAHCKKSMNQHKTMVSNEI